MDLKSFCSLYILTVWFTSLFAVLRNERNELLHRVVWRVSRVRCPFLVGVGSSLWPSDRTTQISQH